MQRYWSGTIGAIVLEEEAGNVAGFQITGAAAFEFGFTSSVQISPDGFGHFHYAPAPYGQTLEIEFIHIPAALLREIVEAFKAPEIIPGGGSIPCLFEDGFQTIEGNFRPDEADFYTRGEPDGDYVKNAKLKLLYTGV